MSLLPQLVRSQHLLLTRTAPVGRLLRPATRHIFDYRPTKPLTDRMDEYTKKTKSILPFLLAKLADQDADTPLLICLPFCLLSCLYCIARSGRSLPTFAPLPIRPNPRHKGTAKNPTPSCSATPNCPPNTSLVRPFPSSLFPSALSTQTDRSAHDDWPDHFERGWVDRDPRGGWWNAQERRYVSYAFLLLSCLGRGWWRRERWERLGKGAKG